jgi:hypothetical protein
MRDEKRMKAGKNESGDESGQPGSATATLPKLS